MSNKKTINKNIENINKEDMYSLMLIMLYASSENPKYSALNELAYLLDHDSFLNFVKYYEGQVLKVPSKSEMQNSLRTLLLYQYYKVERLSWHEALTKAGFSLEDSHSAKRRLIKFSEIINKYDFNFGGTIL